jgi:hypothetical protein
MKKQTFNWILRVWIGLASLGTMVGGWVIFSHAPKPGADAATTTTSAEGEFAPIPTLSPLPTAASVQALPRQQAQQVQPQQSAPQLSQPRLRTRGS